MKMVNSLICNAVIIYKKFRITIYTLIFRSKSYLPVIAKNDQKHLLKKCFDLAQY